MAGEKIMATQIIYLVQHGLAVEKDIDPVRPLSKTGVQQTELVANTLLAAEISVSSIFHSGKLRASQTAKIFSDALALPAPSAIDGLSPNDDVTLLAQNLSIDDALYVGHLPHLEKLTSYLVTKDEDAAVIKFQNSGVTCLEKENLQYHIKWVLTPELTGIT
jgi:phosphohistidine phosphatase